MSYVAAYFHCVFATKDRRPDLNDNVRSRLWPYLAGIAWQNGFKALEVGGVADHVHMLVSLPGTMPVSKAMQLIKGGSSKWIHETFQDLKAFAWGEKYGAFSVSVSQLDVVTNYIRNQEEHHRKRSFKDEFVALLKSHGVEFEEQYLWR